MGIAYNTSIVRNGLILHLDAANPKSYPGSGTSWNDLSGRNNNATLVGSPTITNSIIQLNGSQNITIPTSPNWNFGLNDFAFDMWFNLSTYISTTNNPTLFGVFPYYSASPNGFLLCVTPVGKLGFYTDSYETYAESLAIVVPLNTWLHCVVTRVSGILKFYIQGSVVLSIDLSTFSVVNSTGISIGKDITQQADFFTGSVSNFKAYSKGLTQLEIQQNFEATRGRYGV